MLNRQISKVSCCLALVHLCPYWLILHYYLTGKILQCVPFSGSFDVILLFKRLDWNPRWVFSTSLSRRNRGGWYLFGLAAEVFSMVFLVISYCCYLFGHLLVAGDSLVLVLLPHFYSLPFCHQRSSWLMMLR